MTKKLLALKRFSRLIGLLGCWAGMMHISLAQSVNNDVLRELARNQQLMGHNRFDSLYSTVNANQLLLQQVDSLLGQRPLLGKGHRQQKRFFSVQALPVSVTQLYNTELPHDWNLGAMIPAKGYQVSASAGLYARLGKRITLQLSPQVVYAQNPYFDQFPQQLGAANWAAYYRFLNTSDLPVRFGDQSYAKLLPGQSSIRYHFKSFSAGISTENMWWGPGWKNALIMSTNAPGFLHLTFNTTRPVRTKIGSFEGQVIAGKLDESGILPPRIYSSYNGAFLYQPRNPEWRYISAMVLTWQPKWTPNLYLGIAKASYLYHSDISNPLDVLPLQGFFGRKRTEAERLGKKSSLGSLFVRYVMPGDHAELYMEYGRKDLSLMPWNIIQTDAYRRAYVAGVRKLFPTRNQAHIQLAVELTQLQAPTAELIRDPDSWYTDRFVRQGYTHMGKTIGAGIGPGSNSQTLAIAWVKGAKKIGLQFERLRHNSDFYYYAFEKIGDFRRHWVDLSTTAQVSWNWKQVWLNAQLAVVRSYNYQWLIVQVDPTNYFVPGNEFLNIQGNLSVTYRL